MAKKNKSGESDSLYLVLLMILNGVIIKYGFVSSAQYYWLLLITLPLLMGVISKLPKRRDRAPSVRSRVPRLTRYSIEPELDEQWRGQRHRSAYVRYRIFMKGR